MFVSQIYDEVAEILGTTDQAKIFRKLTQAIQVLMESGHWLNTTAEVDVCTGWDGVTITLPRNVEIPLAVNVDGSPLYFRDRAFQYHVNKGGMYNTVGWAWDDRGYHALQMDIVRPSQLVAVAEATNDAGQYLRVLGTDKWNRPLRSQLPDGTGVDGLLIPIHSQKDFQYGTITPDGNTVVTRQTMVTPINTFTTATPHFLTSGVGMQLTAPTGTVPLPLSNGTTYYIGVLDAYTLQLYTDSLSATQADYPLALQSLAGYQSLLLTDSRPSSVNTALQLSAAPSVSLNAANEISFAATNNNLPSPLKSGVTYFANQLDSTHLQVFSSLSDAENNTNPINTTGFSGSFSVDLRKAITPNTELTFPSAHYFQPGDQVEASNSGGALPQPLLAGENYYVGVIDSKTVTLHLSSADALIGQNAINLITAGSGSNTLVKLSPATAQFGASNNMTATGTNFVAATGSGASAFACVSGPVTNVVLNSAGNGYAVNPVITISDVGGAGYPSTGTVVSFVGACTTSAAATANINSANGNITSITVTNAGAGYTSAPEVYIYDSNHLGKGAVATAAINSSGQVTSVTLQPVGSGAQIFFTPSVSPNAPLLITGFNPGSGYEIPPFVTISDASGGSGATATCQVSYGVSNVVVSSPGAYSVLPTLNFSSPNITGGTAPTYSFTTSGSSPNIAITSINILTPGTGYTSAPSVTLTGGTGTAATLGTVSLTTTGSILQGSISITASGSGYSTAPTVTFSGGGTPTTIAQGTATLGTGSNAGKVTAITITNTGAGYTSSPTVYVGGSGASITTQITTNFVSRYVLTNVTPGGGTANTTGGTGSGYTYNPYVQILGGGGTGATAVAQFNNLTGEITSISPITQGSGYTSLPGVTLVAMTGNFVQFSSTGTLPAPLAEGTPYMVGTPSPNSLGGQSFSVLNADGSPLTITGLGNGSLYVAISRAFGVSWTGYWTGDFSGLSTSTPTPFYFGTDYLLPSGVVGQSGGGSGATATATVSSTGTISSISVSAAGTGYSYPPVISFTGGGGGSGAVAVATVNSSGNVTGITVTNPGSGYLTTPTVVITSIGQSINAAIDNGITQFYLVVSANGSGQLTQAQVYDTLAHAQAGGPIGLVTPVTFGTGQTYYALRTSVVGSLPYNNLITPNSAQYLQTGETVQFSTTSSGTLPSPLVASTNYTISLNGSSFTVYDTNNQLVTLTNSGVGQLFTNVIRNVTPVAATNLTADASLYETGTSVIPRANPGDVLPAGLTPATTYYVRRLDSNTFELYATYAEALNLASTTGRVTYTTTGNTLSSYFFVDSLESIIFVSSVTQVDKPVTDGYVSLYAYDYGRSNDMTLIGQYHPTETNPQYRRVRIGKPCAWARILYRVQAPLITSIYDFIPLEQSRAIINAVHAMDLEDKDFAEQASRYMAMAYTYLKNQYESQTGHAMQAPQINNITYGDKTDPVIEGYGYTGYW
jgi:hypothetical protein